LDVVDQNFAAENAHDVAATLATYTDDIVWDDVTHPLSPVHGKKAVGTVYSDIIDSIPTSASSRCAASSPTTACGLSTNRT